MGIEDPYGIPPEEEEGRADGTVFHRAHDRARDHVPDEPATMAPEEEYRLSFAGKRQRILSIFRVLRRYDVLHGITPVRLRKMLEELGPTFVKMGQILSTRSEVLPQSYCDELAKLRTDAAPVPFAVVRDCLEAELKRPLDAIFSRIDEKPLGSASLAQVHRATLVTGEEVAVKVQRPGVQQVMAQDIDIMRSIARHANRFMGDEPILDLADVVEELWLSFREETNFLMEAHNLEDFFEYNRAVKPVSCPRAYLSLCTEHVVVMEYVEGISISKPDELRDNGYDLAHIGRVIVDNYARQVLDDGFFHADPHAGNIIMRDGIVFFIDLGMVGRISSHVRSILKDIIFSVAEGDTPKLKDALTRLDAGHGSARVDHAAFLSELDAIVADFASIDLKDLNIGEFLTSIITLAKRNRIELPSVVTLVARGMVTLEGLLAEYMPDVNMIEIISEHIANEKSGFRRLEDALEELSRQSGRSVKGVLSAGEYSGLALRMLTRGQLKMNTELIGSEKIIQQVGGIMDRLSMAVIIAGLFIGSSVVYFADIKPVIFGIPVLGFLGYASALVLALLVGKDIWKNGHGKRR